MPKKFSIDLTGESFVSTPSTSPSKNSEESTKILTEILEPTPARANSVRFSLDVSSELHGQTHKDDESILRQHDEKIAENLTKTEKLLSIDTKDYTIGKLAQQNEDQKKLCKNSHE